MGTGPLTGRAIEDELETAGPMLAGTFVTMEEAHAALRALSDAGITAEVTPRDEPFPMTVSRAEPAIGLTVAGPDLPRAKEALRVAGFLPTAVARFRREVDAQAAIAALEAQGLNPRLSVLVLDEIPQEFREEMEPYIVEVPSNQGGAATEILEKSVLRTCWSCGVQIQPGDTSCRSCGEPVA